MTLRSLSSHLAFHDSSIQVRWTEFPPPTPEPALNVLLLPWPMRIATSDLEAVPSGAMPVGMDPQRYGFFRYRPKKDRQSDGFLRYLDDVLVAALDEVHRIDLVVLPESTVSDNSADQLRAVLAKYDVSGYVAGVRRMGDPFDENAVEIRFKDVVDPDRFAYRGPRQGKHHRWCLTGSQIRRYQFGAALDPARNWWEATTIAERELNFVNLGDLLTVCPLICEDLARQDPIAELLRAVGPSLVVCILQDGPQRVDRWASRYASVLADDPGSAILTLSCFGMVDRWHASSDPAPRIVALWKDHRGIPEEIPLDARRGSRAVLLNLRIEFRTEPTADGRGGRRTAGLVLGGVQQIRLDPNRRLRSSDGF